VVTDGRVGIDAENWVASGVNKNQNKRVNIIIGYY
jgi:hypothetical protein